MSLDRRLREAWDDATPRQRRDFVRACAALRDWQEGEEKQWRSHVLHWLDAGYPHSFPAACLELAIQHLDAPEIGEPVVTAVLLAQRRRERKGPRRAGRRRGRGERSA